jgi:hypothetical protein
MKILTSLCILIIAVSELCCNELDVVFTVNAGEKRDTVNANGIPYDPDNNRVGAIAVCGRPDKLTSVVYGEENLYKKVRYLQFDYSFRVTGDGHYTIVLKFAECWFHRSNVRVFNVYLNQHIAISHLDIFDKVGHRRIHNEHIRFSVCDGKMHFNGEEYQLFSNTVNVGFKSVKNNAMLSAMVVFKQKSFGNFSSSLLPSKSSEGFHDCSPPDLNEEDNCQTNNRVSSLVIRQILIVTERKYGRIIELTVHILIFIF